MSVAVVPFRSADISQSPSGSPASESNGRGATEDSVRTARYLEVFSDVAGKKVNLFEDFTGRLDIAGALESEETAMFLYDIDPGESLPYHYEYTEEWLFVVEGSVAVRTPDGDDELQRGDLVRYPAGPEGAHQIANRGDATARVLLFSKATAPAVSVYPDSDTIGVWPDDETEYYFKRGTAVPRDVG